MCLEQPLSTNHFDFFAPKRSYKTNSKFCFSSKGEPPSSVVCSPFEALVLVAVVATAPLSSSTWSRHHSRKDESKLYMFLELVTKGSLASLHHRDIKCANILVDANGSAKLAYFGLAKATKLNDIKSCKGTSLWMAPEI
ncbi:hypothetical protein PIB30_069846 [Stylosanthes scabra]|uniref:Protein kinase domain-containing protein n=1 Tax=Stylosanthes scabra TaxID=79078 RepID=A0ABU6QMW5_9FABA|nr:hypothetical protein [Stylosanthes scabra]